MHDGRFGSGAASHESAGWSERSGHLMYCCLNNQMSIFGLGLRAEGFRPMVTRTAERVNEGRVNGFWGDTRTMAVDPNHYIRTHSAAMPHSMSPDGAPSHPSDAEILPDAPDAETTSTEGTGSRVQPDEPTGDKLADLLFDGDDDDEFSSSSAPDAKKSAVEAPV